MTSCIYAFISTQIFVTSFISTQLLVTSCIHSLLSTQLFVTSCIHSLLSTQLFVTSFTVKYTVINDFIYFLVHSYFDLTDLLPIYSDCSLYFAVTPFQTLTLSVPNYFLKYFLIKLNAHIKHEFTMSKYFVRSENIKILQKYLNFKFYLICIIITFS